MPENSTKCYNLIKERSYHTFQSKMVKRKSQPIISSESSSDSEFGSDLDMELLSLAKKKKTSRLASNSPRVEESSDSSDSSVDDSEPEASMQCMKRETKQQQQAESGSSSGEDSDDESESSSSDSESSEESDDEKMEDVEDRATLNALSDTERVRHETEPVNKSGINNNEQSEKQVKKVESEPKANQVLSEDESDSSSSEDSDDESGSSSSESESSDESEDVKMVDLRLVRLVRRPAVVGSVLARRRRSPGI